MTPNLDGITLYNKYVLNRQEKWHRTYIRNVTWRDNRGAKVSNNGLGNADNIKVRIPVFSKIEADREYVENQHFDPASDPDKWTLRDGDYIAKGIVEAREPEGEDTYQIIEFSDNRDVRNSAFAQHWRVTIK